MLEVLCCGGKADYLKQSSRRRRPRSRNGGESYILLGQLDMLVRTSRDRFVGGLGWDRSAIEQIVVEQQNERHIECHVDYKKEMTGLIRFIAIIY